MKKYMKNRPVHGLRAAKITAAFRMGVFAFLLAFLPSFSAFAQQIDKVQQVVNSIKETNYNEDQDYITDGKRIIWVKSWKKWIPDDFVIMQKEDPGQLKFLTQAIQRRRFDVLEQLLPEYYRVRGGVKAFAADILRNQPRAQSGGKKL